LQAALAEAEIEQQEREPTGSFFYSRAGGFSLLELVTVMIIVSILAIVAIPRLSRGSFDEARLFDETEAALRYAQRTALASQRTICVTITSTSVTLKRRPAYDDNSCGGGDLNVPAPAAVDGASTYTVTRQGNASLSMTPLALPQTVYFDRLGKPSFASNQTLTIGTRSMVIEAETGYVH
jgi:MSHA pilin protein MshC